MMLSYGDVGKHCVTCNEGARYYDGEAKNITVAYRKHLPIYKNCPRPLTVEKFGGILMKAKEKGVTDMLDYRMELSEASYMRVYTPDALALSFPFVLYEEGYFEAGRAYYTVRDAKPTYLLLYTVSGAGTVKVDGKLRQLSAGYAALVDCREAHEFRTVSDEPWRFHFVHFDSVVMEGYKKLLLDEFDSRRVSETLRFMRAFERIHELSDEGNVMLRYALFSDLVSGLLLILASSEGSAEGQRDVDYEAVRTACRYIEDNLKSDISIDGLASLVHLSKFYFIRLFKRLMGVPPYQYVQITRINAAKKMLMSQDFRINEIADAVGFSSATRFTKFFTEMTGMSPSEFRKNSISLSR